MSETVETVGGECKHCGGLIWQYKGGKWKHETGGKGKPRIHCEGTRASFAAAPKVLPSA